MGFDINWGLAAPVDVGGALTNGFQRGQAMRQEADSRSALAAYGMNPSVQTAGALLRVDPRLGMQALTQERGKAQQLQERQITSAAVTGDPAAKAQLAGINPEMWMKLDDRTKAQVKKSTEFMGNAAYDVSRAPPEQRAQMWQTYVQRAEASGMDIPTQYETYSPEALNAVVAEVGKMEEFIKFHEPEYKVIPQGGFAQGFQYGVPIAGGPSTTQPPQPGAPSGAAPAPPNVGDVVNGYRYKGGALNDPRSYEAEGGAGSGPRTFPSPSGFTAGTMTSGRRTVEGNALVKGVPNSPHLRGDGADFIPASGMSMPQLAVAAYRYFGPHAKIINEGDHVHVELPGYGQFPYYGVRGTTGLK